MMMIVLFIVLWGGGRGGGGADFSQSKDNNSVFKAPASASMPLRLFVEGIEGITFNPF